MGSDCGTIIPNTCLVTFRTSVDEASTYELFLLQTECQLVGPQPGMGGSQPAGRPA